MNKEDLLKVGYNKDIKLEKVEFHSSTYDYKHTTKHKLFEENYELKQEIERLNNIINELEKHCETMLGIFEQMTDEQKKEELHKYAIFDDFLTRLKKLKGVDKE